ncbi:MAG TPA: flagellar motor switch protein FliN [Fibrobacteraceae bacterium]|nr:flagellar motor switch protein FliN [Fibrobacteraceae bacterium]
MSKDDGLLSQEDIDALTQGLGLGNVALPQATGPEYEAAKKLLHLISEQASSVVSTVLSRQVDFQVVGLQTKDEIGSLPADMVAQGLLLGGTFKKDLAGVVNLALEKKSVAILADLMLMGAGNVEYSEDHKDAIQEIMNQVLGSSSTTLSGEIGISTEISLNSAVELQEETLGAYQAGAELKLHIEGFPEQKAYWLLDAPMLESLKTSKFCETVGDTPDTSLSSLGLGAAATGNPVTPSASTTIGTSAPASSESFAATFGSTGNKALDLLMDIELPITIELGRTQMSLKRILELGPGAIVEMERFAGEPVDILINGKVVAKGEVVVVDENFGVRLVALVSPEERIKMLR